VSFRRGAGTHHSIPDAELPRVFSQAPVFCRCMLCLRRGVEWLQACLASVVAADRAATPAAAGLSTPVLASLAVGMFALLALCVKRGTKPLLRDTSTSGSWTRGAGSTPSTPAAPPSSLDGGFRQPLLTSSASEVAGLVYPESAEAPPQAGGSIVLRGSAPPPVRPVVYPSGRTPAVSVCDPAILTVVVPPHVLAVATGVGPGAGADVAVAVAGTVEGALAEEGVGARAGTGSAVGAGAAGAGAGEGEGERAGAGAGAGAGAFPAPVIPSAAAHGGEHHVETWAGE
jgi:hypothetical protein